MTRSRCTAPDVRSWLVICAAVASTACGPELRPPDASNPPPPGFPTDTAGYRARLAQYPAIRGGYARDRTSKCFWGKYCPKIRVNIVALGTTSLIDPDNAPDSAVPVAHLVNLDKEKTEKYYGLLPSDQAEYDLWVNKKPGSNNAEWRIVGVMKATGTFVYGEVVDLTYCHNYAVKPGSSDADFAQYRDPCDVPLNAASSTVSKSSLSFSAIFTWILAAEEDRSAGGWIECPNGCCT